MRKRRWVDLYVALNILTAASLTAQATRGHHVELENWPSPLYWQPVSTEATGLQGTAEGERVRASTVSAAPLVLVALPPCRIVDTRGTLPSFTGPYGPPALQGGDANVRTIPIIGQCGVPAGAQAFSLNITVLPFGPVDFLTIFPTGQSRPQVSTLNDYQGVVVANAAVAPAGNTGAIDVFVTQPTHLLIDINGYYAPQNGIVLAQGSAVAPTLSFAGDLGTGIFSPGAGVVDIATAGTNRFSVDDVGNIGIFGNLGIGINGSPGQKLHIGDGNILLEGGGETAIKIKLDKIFNGGPSGTSKNPLFECGRIIQAGDMDPEFRCIYSDDNTPERSVFEFDRKGIVSSVKTGRGSHFEGYLSTIDPQPAFRLNSAPKMRLEMGEGGTNLVDVVVQRDAANTLTFLTAGAERLRIDPTGNVGISTQTPRDLLEVNGDIRVGGCVKNSGSAPIAGTCLSDAGLKTNVRPFSPVLARLGRLQPVYFDWLTTRYPEFHFGTSRSYGLIAQEIEQDFPDLVSEDKRGFKAVDYSQLPFLLLQAIRDLKAENDTLHEQFKSQDEQRRKTDDRLRSLQSLVSALQKTVDSLMLDGVPDAK